MRCSAVCFLGILLMCINRGPEVKADSLDSLQRAYINQYKDLARQQMMWHRIPASITMAQALLESAAGTSRLATEANNHFGIKCSKGWVGDSIQIDDDRPQDCFRKYLHADSSYADRVQFLAKPRYRFLFDSLSITDYQGWAYGLKRAGYATDTLYPLRLINLIERLSLQSLDSTAQATTATSAPLSTTVDSPAGLENTPNNDSSINRNLVQRGVKEGIIYVAQGGESPLSVSQKTGVALYKLQTYNQLDLSLNQFEKGKVLILNRHRYNKLRQTSSN